MTEEMLTSFLRKHAGKPINYWKPVRQVADELVGHDKKYSPVHYLKRYAKRVEVSRILNAMIRAGKVIRYRDYRRHTNDVRLNEAFV